VQPVGIELKGEGRPVLQQKAARNHSRKEIRLAEAFQHLRSFLSYF